MSHPAVSRRLFALAVTLALVLSPARADTTIGDALIDRSFNDGAAGQVYIYDTPAGTAGLASTFSFFDNEPGSRAITPLLFERTTANTYVLRAVGTTRASDGSGAQSFAFAAVAGTAAIGTDYTFGFTDRAISYSGSGAAITTTATNTGSVDFAYTSANHWRFTPTLTFDLSLGQVFTVGTDLDSAETRTYSAQLTIAPPDYTVTSSGGVLTVTDNLGQADSIGLFATSSTTLKINVSGRTLLVDGVVHTGDTGDIDVSAFTSIVIHAGDGDDYLAVNSLPSAYTGSLTLDGGTGTDHTSLSSGLPALSGLAIATDTLSTLPALTIGNNGLAIASDGTIAQSAPFEVTGSTALSAGANSIALTQANIFNGPVSASVTGDKSISLTAAAPLTLSAISAGTGVVVLVAPDLTFTGGSASIAGAGSLYLTPSNDSATIGLGAGAIGSFNLDATDLAALADGFNGIYIGVDSTATGALDVTTATFSDPVYLFAGSASVGNLLADASSGLVLTAYTGPIVRRPGSTGLNFSGLSVRLIGQLSFPVASASDYGTLSISGNVNLAGTSLALTDASGGTYTPAPTDSFVLINNQNSNPLFNQLTALPAGSTVNVNGVDFTLTYTGGDGNDLALFIPPPRLTVAPFGGSALSTGTEVNYGAVVTTTTRSFTLANDGAGPLHVTGLALSGTDAAAFQLTSAATPFEVAAGGATSFSAVYTPTAFATQIATLTLTTDDPDFPVFTLPLRAAGSHVLAGDWSDGSEIPLATAYFDPTGYSVSLNLHYAPAPGTDLVLMRVTSHALTPAEFGNLRQGQRVSLAYDGQFYDFIADYYGGDGNDLVLHWAWQRLVAWGYGTSGQLGNGASQNQVSPVPVTATGVLAGKFVTAGARGFYHTLVLCSDGTLATWGGNTTGALGNGTAGTFAGSKVPVLVDLTGVLAGKRIVSVAAGIRGSYALCADGSIAAWGQGTYGQLGNGLAADSAVPVLVDTATGTSALAGHTPVKIVAADYHALALCSDGTLVQWGHIYDNAAGDWIDQLSPAAVPVAGTVLEGRSIVDVVLSNNANLVLCSDGTLAIWGQAGSGQLASYSSHSYPTALTGGVLTGRTPVAIAASSVGFAVLCADGRIVTWGTASGDGVDNAARYTPVLVANTSPSAFASHTPAIITGSGDNYHALCTDGTVVGWGTDDFGVLGQGINAARVTPTVIDFSAALATGERLTRFFPGPGSYHGVAFIAQPIPPPRLTLEDTSANPLSSDTSTLSVGTATLGFNVGAILTLRNTGQSPLHLTAAAIAGIHAADFHLSNLTVPQTVDAGASLTFNVAFHASVAGPRSATLVLTSDDPDHSSFSLGLSATASDRMAFNLAHPTASARSLPGFDATGLSVDLTLSHVPAPGETITLIQNNGSDPILGQFANLHNGRTVALDYDGTTYPFVAWYYGGDGNDLVLLWPATGVAAWGWNGSGQLGDGTTDTPSSPVDTDLSGVLDGQTLVQIARGSEHVLALTAQGRVYAWGRNEKGQLGVGTADANEVHTTPVAVVTAGTALAGKTVVAIAAGHKQSYALCADGTLAAWGWNEYGQLGDGTTTDAPLPVAVVATGSSALNGHTPRQLSAGETHVLVLCTDGTVAAWGNNNYGALGEDVGALHLIPAPIYTTGPNALTGRTAVAVAAGYYHSLILCSDGTLASFGYGFNGLLGLGKLTSGYTAKPSAVDTTSGVSALADRTPVAIAATLDHSLALCSDGSLVTWGDNTYGAIGDGTTTHRPSPVLVSTGGALVGKSIRAFAVAGSTNLVVTTDSAYIGFGSNYNGLLDATLSNVVSTPTALAAVQSYMADRPLITLAGSGHNDGQFLAIYGKADTAAARVHAAFDDWAGSSGLTTPADPLADPDADGVPNLLEFALALDPATGSGSTTPPPAVNPATGEVTYVYVRNKAAVASGLVFTIQWSTSLTAGWQSGTISESIEDLGATERVTAVLPATAQGLFLRLKVSEP